MTDSKHQDSKDAASHAPETKHTPVPADPANKRQIENAEAMTAPTDPAAVLGAMILAVNDYATGKPVDMSVSAGDGLTFQVVNPEGMEYDFTASGNFTLRGVNTGPAAPPEGRRGKAASDDDENRR